MELIKRYNKLFFILLFPAVCWLFFNAIYYRHYHQMSSGIIISHAHPYDKGCASAPYASHEHSEDEFLLYDIISHTALLFIISIFLTLALFKTLLKQFYFNKTVSLYYSSFYLTPLYRGPPFYI